jgi:hypothetical protein
MIIGLLGSKGSGKTLAASVLQNKGFRKLSFAGPLKKLLSETFDIPTTSFTDGVLKEQASLNVTLDALAVKRILDYARRFYNITEEQTTRAILNAPNAVISTPRQLMQAVGTDIFRNQVSNEYWLNVFKAQLDPIADFVVDDVRFANEREVIQKLGGYVIGIERFGLKNNDLHASEQLDLTQADFRIQNKYSIETYVDDVENVYQLIKQELEWQKSLKNAMRQNTFGGNSES